ncbi:MAG: DUF1599 domain-containing protein [Bacteroidales bacterium]|nr:DUF1599 domain-containing protein [Bacteroidales bacterium]
MPDTLQEYDAAVAKCRSIFTAKMNDYGCAWRILRPSSLTDQIYIKANRIRSIQCKGNKKVDEGEENEFIGIVNYSVMALIQLEKGFEEGDSLPQEEIAALYEQYILNARSLMENKNHDYDEAWRNMRISSIDDIILMKLLRVKQIEDHHGKTLISEGVDANYYDIINYAIFALILLNEQSNETIR